jgi:hypothetical protein
MLSNGFPKRIEQDCVALLADLQVFAIYDRKLCVHLRSNARRKTLRSSLVHGDRRCAAQDASEKRRHPFRGIPSPEQNPIAVLDTLPLKFTRALCRKVCNFYIG